MSALCKIFYPTLGVDAAAISNEAEDHEQDLMVLSGLFSCLVIENHKKLQFFPEFFIDFLVIHIIVTI
jgi:hypothetical protein